MTEKYKQDPPFSIQVELVEGCNLACSFCGMQGIRDNGANGPDFIHGFNSKPYKFMTTITARDIANQIRENEWNPRIEFAMHGEPTLNPKRVRIVEIFRETCPWLSLMMTSNGGGLLLSPGPTENIDALMNAGLNTLLLDHYNHVKIVDKILNKYSGKYSISYYPQDKKANPHQRRKPKDHNIVICQDISDKPGGTHSTLSNHTGCAFPRNDAQAGKRCAKPFREMAIRWDGSVAICCVDFRGVYKCGNVNRIGIQKIWYSKQFESARKAMYHGMRVFAPCIGCNDRSYRTGLLPDKLGKEILPKPSKKDWAIINDANSGKSYTRPIKRPWE